MSLCGFVLCYSTGMSIRCGHCKGQHESIAEVRACSRPSAPAVVQLEPGFYPAGPKVYRLTAERSWQLLTSSGFWAGRARAPYRPERMTVEEVAAEGRRMVRCIVCGTRLTNPESIERGIGPVCAGKV